MKVEIDFDTPLYYIYYNHGKAMSSKRAHKIASATVTRKATIFALRGCRFIKHGFATSPSRDALICRCNIENMVWAKPKRMSHMV